MYGGKLQKVKFRYSGTDIDAVLDRLPTAQILAEEGALDVNCVSRGKIFDQRALDDDMWIFRSQGENIKIKNDS